MAIVLNGDGLESNRPETNFPGISVDSNRFNCLVEKNGYLLPCVAGYAGKSGPGDRRGTSTNFRGLRAQVNIKEELRWLRARSQFSDVA